MEIKPLTFRRTPKGRQVDPHALAEIEALLGDAPRRKDLLIEYLHRIQDAYGHLSAAHLAALAQVLKLSQVEVYEVATFYHHFDVVKEGEAAPPRVTVRVCDSLSCALAGSDALLKKLQHDLGSDVRVIAAPCLGRCAQAPVAVVHQTPMLRANVEDVQACFKQGQHSPQASATGAAFDPLRFMQSEAAARAAQEGTPTLTDYATYRRGGGYALAAQCLAGKHSPEAIIEQLQASALRGLGGAGFPAGRKWQIVRAQPMPKVMAINIDEGEPGTFKDRMYLERDPHRFLEGMLIAAWAVQAGSVYIYLRDEYHAARAMLERELAALKASPPCALPHIELRRGAGAYICGEESAMIESIEGKRGLPRLRPPYVAQVGLFGYPTLAHNFETLYWVRDILQRGASWFTSFGRRGRTGLRSFSVSGRVKHPGVYLAPAGISVRELIDEYCGGMLPGHALYAYLPGGASGGILPASLADVPLDFDTLAEYGCFIGSAAIIVLSKQDRATDAARNVMQFFAHESCGQCTPCRVGTDKAAKLMAQPAWDMATLNDLCEVMEDASICSLGQAAPNAVRCVAKYFAHELNQAKAAA
ncbi:MAG: NAD(P)H-dependent oxidoreductase subunit E [Burkholderiaceae bacterium]